MKVKSSVSITLLLVSLLREEMMTASAFFVSTTRRGGGCRRIHLMGLLSDDNDNDDGFYKDLQRAKMEKLGTPIPPEQLKASAQDAESEFLKAMQETTQEFEAAKAELGSDGAVDLFLGKIQAEDERKELEDDDDDEEDEEED
jgi:hypothetical protein